jgi:hypothetical protein
MITNERMAVRTAKNLVKFLNKKGAKCSSDFKYKPIRKVLRDSWYVDKLMDCGQTDCIHIDLECGSFLVVTNDCKLMSGQNIMIMDAIYSIFAEYVEGEWDNELFWKIKGIKSYSDEWGDNGMELIEPSKFCEWVSSLKFYS